MFYQNIKTKTASGDWTQSKVGKEEYYKAPNKFSVCTLFFFCKVSLWEWNQLWERRVPFKI